MSKSPRQRQTEFRERVQARGFSRLSVIVEGGTAATIRKLAKQHQSTQSDIIKLGALLAAKALADSSEG